MCRIDLSTFFNFTPFPTRVPKAHCIFLLITCLWHCRSAYVRAHIYTVRMYFAGVYASVLIHTPCSVERLLYDSILHSISIIIPGKKRHITHKPLSLTHASSEWWIALMFGNAKPLLFDLSFLLSYKHKHHLPHPILSLSTQQAKAHGFIAAETFLF